MTQYYLRVGIYGMSDPNLLYKREDAVLYWTRITAETGWREAIPQKNISSRILKEITEIEALIRLLKNP